MWRVNCLIDVCGSIVAAGREPMGWFDVSTLKEPYRIEGKKTMGIELADQLGWELPDVIFYPTGGGTGLIGMWKAFVELSEVGWVRGPLPRMVAVQSEGCAPIVKAWEEGADHAEPWQDAVTIASGIRVPSAIGDFLMLRAIRESDGFAIAVPDSEISEAQERLAGSDGLLTSPEGAATVAAYERARDQGLVGGNDRVVLFNCGSGLKYPMPRAAATLDHRVPIDWGGDRQGLTAPSSAQILVGDPLHRSCRALRRRHAKDLHHRGFAVLGFGAGPRVQPVHLTPYHRQSVRAGCGVDELANPFRGWLCRKERDLHLTVRISERVAVGHRDDLVGGPQINGYGEADCGFEGRFDPLGVVALLGVEDDVARSDERLHVVVLERHQRGPEPIHLHVASRKVDRSEKGDVASHGWHGRSS